MHVVVTYLCTDVDDSSVVKVMGFNFSLVIVKVTLLVSF